MPGLSGQKGEGKRREPAMKVWNHLVWQDLGEFGATLARVARWGCSLGRTAKCPDVPNVRNTEALVGRRDEQVVCGGARRSWYDATR